MRLSHDHNAARSVGRNSERFRHRTSQAAAFGGTALRSALRVAATACFLSASLCVQSAHAQAPKPQIKLDIYSVERNTCREWMPTSLPIKFRQAQYFWFLGFVSGGNYVLPSDQIGASKMLSETQFETYVTAQCRKDSEQTITTISLGFVNANSPSGSAPKQTAEP